MALVRELLAGALAGLGGRLARDLAAEVAAYAMSAEEGRDHEAALRWDWAAIRDPLRYAAANHNLLCLQWARSSGPWPQDAAVWLAAGGSLGLLRWARAEGCRPHVGVCDGAALFGRFDVLRWAHLVWGCHVDERTSSAAAAAGNLPMLQWLRAQGHPWDGTTCSAAARKGHTQVLEWALTNGCPIDGDSLVQAAKGGHQATLAWLTAEERVAALGPDFPVAWQTACRAAAGAGQLAVLQWMWGQPGPWRNDLVFDAAAEGGHLAVLQWGRRSRRMVWWWRVCETAARFGHLELLVWAHENGAPLSEEVACAAFRGACPGVIRWLGAVGCPGVPPERADTMAWLVEASPAEKDGGAHDQPR